MTHRIVASVVLTLCVVPAMVAAQEKSPAAPAPQASSAKFILDKKEREDLYKKVKDFFDPVESRAEAKERDGVDSEKYKTADKKAKTAETALRNYLKNTLSKKYKIDADCLAATLDWTAIFSEYLAAKSEFSKADKTLGTEQQITLREEPKSNYWRRIPKPYDPKKRAWPVLLYVQEKGKSGKLFTSEEMKVKSEGKADVNMLLDGDLENPGCITVVIDLPENAWDDPLKLRACVLKPLQEIRSLLRVDANRIVIGGSGAGAKAAASVVESYPWLFAAYVAKGGDPGEARPENFVNTPVFLMGDAAGFDKEVSDGNGGKSKWGERLTASGGNVTVKADAKPDDLAAWMSKQSRNPYPSRVMSSMKSDRRQRPTVWFSYDPDPAKESRVEVTANREKNEIVVNCDGVTRYYLFLSDAVVDLSKPVTIKTNDQVRTEQLPPTFETLRQCFEEYYGGTDMGALFTSRPRPIDVPRKKKEAAADPGPASRPEEKK